MVDRRTHARLARDFETADMIKSELVENGIDVVDRENTWSAYDGRISGFQTKIKERLNDFTNFNDKDGETVEKRVVECKLSHDQVQSMVDVRTRARRNRNFELSDQIESDLKRSGITVNNKENTWKAMDGSISGLQSNDYKLREQEEKTYIIKEDVGVSTPCSISAEEAQNLIEQRTSARRNRDFDLADVIRADLATRGIEVFDKDNRWSAFDKSISGKQSEISGDDYSKWRAVTVDIPCTLSAEQAQELVDARVVARRKKQFEDADSIKTELLENGIELIDRENAWRALDGNTDCTALK